ncbi:MAG: glycosyltransferase family 2 protein, partial [Pseudomonadota bacterium]
TQKVRKSISSLETQLSSRFTPVDITCVITSYNNADTLRRAITSVLAQEPPIKKIIIADDGSEDGSRDLIRSIARDHPQISAAFRDRNLGPSLNRHLALLEASTPFITQLDGDDAFAATKILAETKALEGDLNAIAFSDILIEKTDGENHFVNTEVFEQISSKSDRVWHLATRASPPPRDMLLSKQTYLAAGGYSSAIGIYEDWDLKIRLASLVDNWRHSGAVGTKYLRSGTGLSSINATRHAYWLTRVISKNITSILAARDDRSLHELADVISRHTSKLSSAQYLLNTIDYFDHGFISDIDLRSKFEAFDYRAPSNPTANEIDSRFQVFRTPKPADYPRDNGPEREHNKQPIAVLTKTSFIHHGDTQV